VHKLQWIEFCSVCSVLWICLAVIQSSLWTKNSVLCLSNFLNISFVAVDPVFCQFMIFLAKVRLLYVGSWINPQIKRYFLLEQIKLVLQTNLSSLEFESCNLIALCLLNFALHFWSLFFIIAVSAAFLTENSSRNLFSVVLLHVCTLWLFDY